MKGQVTDACCLTLRSLGRAAGLLCSQARSQTGICTGAATDSQRSHPLARGQQSLWPLWYRPVRHLHGGRHSHR